MLWSVTVGVLLDKKNNTGSLGQRLKIKKGKDFNQYSFSPFKYYLPEYNNWRDGAIATGLKGLQDGNDILLIAMDLKQCFYFLKTDWEEINREIEKSDLENKSKEFCYKLNQLLSIIHYEYLKKTREYLRVTHYHTKNIEGNKNVGLPIGLPSSRILSNWELRIVDKLIVQKLSPMYYGRYVDDFLIVLKNPNREFLSISKIIENYFIKTKLFEKVSKDEPDSPLKILSNKKINNRFEYLEIQNNKLIFQFYAHEGSWTGLSEFQNELNKQASEFRFLPEQSDTDEFIDDAYDINFDGSKNKLRSVIGVKENSTKLSSQLYGRMLRYWLGNHQLEEKEKDQLSRFYQGRNIFEYARTWERVFTLYVGTNELSQCIKYYNNVIEVIKKLSQISSKQKDRKNFISKAKEDTIRYLRIALSSALAFESKQNRFSFVKENKKLLSNSVFIWAEAFRKSHMLRHQFVRWPLIEFISTDVNLISTDINSLDKNYPWNWDLSVFKYSPRFIFHHEYSLLIYLKELLTSDKIADVKDILNKYKKLINFNTNKIVISNKPKKGFDINEIKVKNSYYRKKVFYIGVANIKVKEENFKASYSAGSKPNLSIERQEEFFQIINEASRHKKCDLIVFPEISVPYMWLPFMATTSKKHGIGMAFGLEHLIINKIAYNLIATILPYGYKAGANCFLSLRVKNHYSPHEKIELEKNGYTIPESNLYEKIFWRNCWFSTYNCFELTNINARSLFKSEIDLLVSIVMNKDVNYYSSLIDATARDLHLYIVQANNSDFGDSRVLSPRNTEVKDIIRVKGGENPVLLKGLINIQELRDFQNKSHNKDDNRFKPTPAGFELDKVIERSNISIKSKK